LEILCALIVMVLLSASLSGVLNLNAFVIVVMAIAVYAVLRDVRSLWQSKQRPLPKHRAQRRRRDTAMASSSEAVHGQHD
jgi:hypothetical protein